jgi:hypothetical protein
MKAVALFIGGGHQTVGRSGAYSVYSGMLAELLFKNKPEDRAFEKGSLSEDKNLNLRFPRF